MKNYNFDETANKIRTYFSKSGNELDKTVYEEEQQQFIEYTMSCDAYEVIGTAKAILREMIFSGTSDRNRIQKYSEYLAIYDIYESVLNDIKF